MHPVICELNLCGRDVVLKSYTCFISLAAISLVILGAEIARRRGLDPRRVAISLFLGVAATAVSARLIHWLTNPSSFDGIAAVFTLDRTNLSAFAGMVPGVFVAALAARAAGVDVWRMADAAAPALGLSVALSKVGCLLNGCCYGVAAHGPFGVGVSSGSEAHLAQIASGSIGLFDAPLPIHPVQIYEASASLLGCLIAVWIMRRSRLDGLAFLVFALCFSAARWVISSLLYVPSSYEAPHWLYPALYALIISACTAKLLTLILRHHSTRQTFRG